MNFPSHPTHPERHRRKPPRHEETNKGDSEKDKENNTAIREQEKGGGVMSLLFCFPYCLASAGAGAEVAATLEKAWEKKGEEREKNKVAYFTQGKMAHFSCWPAFHLCCFVFCAFLFLFLLSSFPLFCSYPLFLFFANERLLW